MQEVCGEASQAFLRDLGSPRPGAAIVGSGVAAAGEALGEGLGRVTRGRSSWSMAWDAPGEASLGCEGCLCPQGLTDTCFPLFLWLGCN